MSDALEVELRRIVESLPSGYWDLNSGLLQKTPSILKN